MNNGPLAPIQVKKQLYSKVFLSLVLVGLLILGLIKLKEIVYQPSLSPEYFPFGLEMDELVSIGLDAELDPDEVNDLDEDQTLYKQALLLHKTGDSQGAWEILDKLIEKHPNHTHVLVLLAQSALASGQVPEVLLDIRRKILQYLQDNEHPTISLQRALIDEKIENPQDARKVIHKIIQKSPQFSQAHFELARLEILSEDYTLARRSLQYSISLDPRTREKSYVMLSQLFHQQGYLDSLEQLLQYSLQNYPYNADFNLYQGYLHEYRAELEEAMRLYKRMKQLHPNDDRYSEAISTLGHKEPPISQAPNQNVPQLNIGIKALEKLQQEDPNNAGLAFAYYKLLILSAQPEFLEKARNFHTQNLNNFKTDPRWNPKYEGVQELSTEDIDSTKDTTSYNDSLLAVAQFSLEQKNLNHKRNWDLMGHYLVPWESTLSELKEKYPKTEFQPLKPNGEKTAIQENYIQEEVKYSYTLVYKNEKLIEILVLANVDPKNNTDLLGDMLHELVGVSGKPSKVRQEYCAGFKKFQAYHWESNDNFEILIQFEGKSWQTRLLRLDPKTIPTPFEICKILPKFLDWEDQKENN